MSELIEKRVADLREELLAGGTMSPADVDELESHLRDEVAALGALAALDDEEAFLVARHRLGRPAALREEYDKVHGATRCALWMVAGYVVFQLAMSLVQAFAHALVAVARGADPRVSALLVPLSLCGLGIGLGVVLWWFLFHGLAGRIGLGISRLTRSARGLAVVASGVLLAFAGSWVVSSLAKTLAMRTLGPEEYMGTSIVVWAYSLLTPPLLVVVMLLVARRRMAARAHA
jgi:hypothetical protein